MSKERIKYVDFFKGGGILLMVMGHIGFGAAFDKLIHGFHMPMFFFISGFMYKHKDKEAYRSMHDWLILEHEPNAYAMAGFVLKNTLSDNGGVTRGICEVNENRTQVVNIVETSNVIKTENGVSADGLVLDPDTYVSMNFWGFPGNPPEFLGVLENGFVFFFKTDVPSNPLKSEYLLPTIIGRMLRKNDCTVTLLQTHDTWYGMTYKEDAASVADHFDEMIREGKYKRELYSDLH